MRSGFAALPSLARLAAALALAAPAAGQEPPPIEDNSFLIEEAYNQETRVVQHVTTFEHPERGSDWEVAFTQEWPLGGRRHQLSYTIPWARTAGTAGLTDLAVHYRFQLRGSEGGPLAIAPRVSLLLPSGNERRGLGAGTAGLEVNLPMSARLGRQLVAHWNLGGSWTPDARGPGGAEADLANLRVGQGLVWLARPRFNLLLETLWTPDEVVAGPGVSLDRESFVVAPGLRFAIDLPSGLQIVPGVAVPIGVGPSAGERSLFFYLSFEHPF